MLKKEEKIAEILLAVRKLEDFLWGEHNKKLEEWRRMLRKRMAKLDGIDLTNPDWTVELRKREMQVGSEDRHKMKAAMNATFGELKEENKAHKVGGF